MSDFREHLKKCLKDPEFAKEWEQTKANMERPLRECPFCGGKAVMRERFVHGTPNKKHYRLECVECHASFLNWNKNTSKAITAWNNRAEKKEEHREAD